MPDQVGVYAYKWELPAPRRTLNPDAIVAATAELYDNLADLGYRPAGRVTFSVVARVPVVLADDGPEQPRPWESREGLAADLLDLRAA